MKVTVLIATRNRAEALRTTLKSFQAVRLGPLSLELVVVDNGSVDGTDSVLRDFSGVLPLRSIWDPVLGKNHALNEALNRVTLGDIVAFTDDDVTHDPDWLLNIADVCTRWREHAVFGGRIDPTWPVGEFPSAWAQQDLIQVFAFARHRIREEEGEYPEDEDPFGPNFWVRGHALHGMRFLDSIGPHPTRRKVGGETQLLRQLRLKQRRPVYSPSVRVWHRIEKGRLTKRSVYLRALQLGRGHVYTRGLPDRENLERSRFRWKVARMGDLTAEVIQLSLAQASLDENARVLSTVRRLVAIGRSLEALSVA